LKSEQNGISVHQRKSAARFAFDFSIMAIMAIPAIMAIQVILTSSYVPYTSRRASQISPTVAYARTQSMM
jgi:hypothetical protein